MKPMLSNVASALILDGKILLQEDNEIIGKEKKHLVKYMLGKRPELAFIINSRKIVPLAIKKAFPKNREDPNVHYGIKLLATTQSNWISNKDLLLSISPLSERSVAQGDEGISQYSKVINNTIIIDLFLTEKQSINLTE